MLLALSAKILATQGYSVVLVKGLSEPSQLPISSTKFLCVLNKICSFRVPARWIILVVGLGQLSTIISPAQSQSFRRKEYAKNMEVCTLTAYLQLSTGENCPSKLLVSFSAAASTLWLSFPVRFTTKGPALDIR